MLIAPNAPGAFVGGFDPSLYTDESAFLWSENISGASILGFSGDSVADLKIPPVRESTGAPVVFLGGYGHTSIFSNDTVITNLEIPSSVEIIITGSFQNCTNLSTVTLSEGLLDLGSLVFSGCTSLTSITFPDSLDPAVNDYSDDLPVANCTALTYLDTGNGYRGFVNATSAYHPLLETLIIGENVTGFRCGGTPVTSVTINAPLTVLYTYTFDSCSNLTSFTIPETVTSIGAYAFNATSGLTTIHIPASVSDMSGNGIFQYSGISSITFDPGVSFTALGVYAFLGTNLTTITLPDSVTTYNSGLFLSCSLLETVYFGTGTSSIDGGSFFNGCTSLTDVYFPCSEPTMVNPMNYTNVPVGLTQHALVGDEANWPGKTGSAPTYSWQGRDLVFDYVP